MRHWLRSHLTYSNVMVTILAFIVLGGMSYAATGDNFILGNPNSAATPTQLSSPTTDSAGALKVKNTNTTTAGRGITAAGGAGGYGLWASGGNVSKNTAAVHGQSSAGNAIEGFSTANPASGVYGQDNNADSYGVAGHSDNGIAVVGDSSSGWAFQALGNTTQTRAGNGFVKAMALVDSFNHPGDPIQQCFNSQLPPNQATSGNCGISYSFDSGSKRDNLDFGFRVDDRISSATEELVANEQLVVRPGGNVLHVYAWRDGAGAAAPAAYYIVVY